MRVDSVEDLVTTADIIAKVGPVSRDGIGLMAMSGGMCEIAADQAASCGAVLPRLSSATETALRDVVPTFATPNNPLDITGGAMLEPELLGRSLRALRRDEALGVVACLFDAPLGTEAVTWAEKVIAQIASGFTGTGARGICRFSGFVNRSSHRRKHDLLPLDGFSQVQSLKPHNGMFRV